jgi:hypothetical protein
MNEIDLEVETALRSERTLEPSPFFVRRVLAAARAQIQFGPIPFPRKRIAAGVLLLLLVIAAGLSSSDAVLLEPGLLIRALVLTLMVAAVIAFAAWVRPARRVPDR